VQGKVDSVKFTAVKPPSAWMIESFAFLKWKLSGPIYKFIKYRNVVGLGE
jgi:hypothetical protein